MIEWFKKLFYIVKHFDDINVALDGLSYQQRQFRYDIDDAVKTIKDRTTLHADISYTGRHGDVSRIILIGRYRNRDYIQTFEVHPDDFTGLVRQCIEMQRYARIGVIDAVPDMKQIIKHEYQMISGEEHDVKSSIRR